MFIVVVVVVVVVYYFLPAFPGFYTGLAASAHKIWKTGNCVAIDRRNATTRGTLSAGQSSAFPCLTARSCFQNTTQQKDEFLRLLTLTEPKSILPSEVHRNEFLHVISAQHWRVIDSFGVKCLCVQRTLGAFLELLLLAADASKITC